MSKKLTLQSFAIFIGLFLVTAAIAQPANDDCANAVSLTIAADAASCVPTAATTLNATGSADPAAVCSGSWFGDDVWFSFTTGMMAPANGVTVQLGGAVPTFGMAMYLGCGANEIPFFCFSDGSGTQTGGSITGLAANTTYYLRVWSGGGATTNSGAFDICVFESPADPANVIWSETFGDSTLPGWTQNGQPAGADWIWMRPADAGRGAFANPGTTINSPSSNNGAIIFDSDFYDNGGDANNQGGGLFPAAQLGQITSPIIDCSNATVVQLEYYQAVRHFTNSTYTVSYSIDGGATFTDIVTNGGLVVNAATTNDMQTLFLPNAGGSSQVQIRFTYNANYYFWILDDIRLIGTGDFNDLTIANDWYAIAPTYQTPRFETDTVRFMADVANIGTTVLPNVTLDVEITRQSDGMVVHSDSYNYGTLNPGDTVENYIFPTTFLPDTLSETYVGTYTLSSDSTTDNTINNNSASFEFVVADEDFQKTDVPTTSIAPGADNSWTAGSHYFVHTGTGSNAAFNSIELATSLRFGITNADDLAGRPVSILLEKGYDADGDGEIATGERESVAIGSHTFTAADDDVIIDVPLTPLVGTSPVYELEPNTHYLVSVQYVAADPNDNNENMFLYMNNALNYSAANFAAEANGVERYDHFLDIGNTGTYDQDINFSGDPTPVVDLVTVTTINYTNTSVVLSEEALNIFPNPATDVLTASIALEEMAENVHVTIFDIRGKVLAIETYNNVQNEQLTFDVSSFTSGTYMMTIVTDHGYIAKRFVVAK